MATDKAHAAFETKKIKAIISKVINLDKVIADQNLTKIEAELTGLEIRRYDVKSEYGERWGKVLSFMIYKPDTSYKRKGVLSNLGTFYQWEDKIEEIRDELEKIGINRESVTSNGSVVELRILDHCSPNFGWNDIINNSGSMRRFCYKFFHLVRTK